MPQATALAVIKQMTYYLRLSLRAGMTAGLIIALVAVLLGPGKAAVKVRATLSAAFDRAPEGHGGGVITRFVAANRQAIRAVGVVLALALLVAGLTPGAIGVLLAALALAVYLAIVEILARAGDAGSAAEPGEDGTPTPESGSVGSA
jgi:cobalamin synthase